MALGSTQPPTEMSTRSISGGKSGRCVRLTTLPPSWAIFTYSGNLEPSGPLQASNGTGLPFYLFTVKQYISCLQTSRKLMIHLGGRSCTGCFKKSFTTLKAYRNLYRGHTQRFELSKCSKTHRVLPSDSYGSMWLPDVPPVVSLLPHAT